MLFATVRQRKIYVKAPQTVVKDGVNVDVLRLEMDDEWAEMTSIICVFSNGSVKKEVMHTFGQPITVPWECLESTGVLMLGITGYVGTQKVMTTMNADNGWEIVQNSETTGEEQFEATPTLTQQLLEAATSANNAAAAANTAKQDILDAVSNGEFDGAPGKDGADGQPGADGYSPSAKVTQTASGAEITITDKDGTTTATVTNGKDGAAGKDGAPGADGKSAYQYAQDGGYTGTEEEFAGKMAAEIPSIDNTLTKSGQAADAAVVGDRLSALSDEIVTTAASQVSAHNTGTDTHSDIRLLISGLTDRLNALADSDDTTLDQLSEVVAYIKSNRSLIAAVTTSKVSVADIIDNLTTNVINKPLSAAQGVALKAMIDAITIPTALPNPNALTFTGAVTGSYDGSEAMTVEIPAGGGGSGAVGNLKLELIASGTMDADARGITVNLDNDGNPFELSIAALRVTNILRGAAMTVNVGSDINFGSYWMPSCITATTTSTNRDAVAVCTSFGIAYVAQGGGGNQSAASPKCYGAFLPTETIKSVSLKASGAAETLGAGLTYYLYGVRV